MNHCILFAAGVGAAIGGGAVAAVPVIIACLGFTACGIRGGSAAASMMSYSAISSGGGVESGGLVACLQSTGTAVVCFVVTAVIAAIIGTVAGAITGAYKCDAGAAGAASTIVPVTGQGMLGAAVSTTVAGLISNYTV